MEITDCNNNSSSSSKKRKIEEEEEEDEGEHDEQEKIEKFFALVRSIRDTRERWINFKDADSKNNKRNKNIVGKEENDRVAVWKPTFQLEDFAEEEAKCKQNGASQSGEIAKEEDAEKGIDLRLSL